MQSLRPLQRLAWGLVLCALLAGLPEASAEEAAKTSAALTLDQAADLLGLETEATSEELPNAAPPGATRPEAQPRSLGELPPLATRGAELERAAELLLENPDWVTETVAVGIEDLQSGRFTLDAKIAVGIAVPMVALGLLMLVRVLRGRGDVVVELGYPNELQGRFLVSLNLKRTDNNRGRIHTPGDAERAQARALGSRAEHHGVSRETHFRRIPVGTYWISVDGYLSQGEGDEIVASRFEEREVHITRGSSSRLQLDMSPRACPVEVRVVWDRRPVPEAQVARFNAPSSMRLAKGPVTYPLDLGRHVIVAGSADRVAEVPVEVASFQPRSVSIDLADREHLVFGGCPPAVGPYLNGDIPAAARALERDGQREVASRLLARFHSEQGQSESAARHFETAGQSLEAAELRESLGQYEHAAELFEKAGEDERAAEMFRAAGKLIRAGDAYARADSLDAAVACFRKAGDTGRWVDALAKKGEMFEAASVALDQGDRSRAIQYLSEVGATHSRYPDAAFRLAEAYRAEGHLDLAQHKLDELIATRGESAASTEALDLLAQLCEENADHERALSVLEKLRQRDATFPQLAARIERIKQARSKVQMSGTSAATLPGGFGEQSRYEILEEVGRGGMGIVFKARDKRLGRIVALKRLPDNLRNHPRAVELFLREARAAASLNHPNIVTLFDADQEDGTYYITMELLEGNPLQRILRARKRLSPVNVAKLGGQVATGLHYAHRGGIVHRDIKTANLFFTKDKVVKIMDFGLAKMQEEVRRATTVIGGTPYYMAPEQSAGQEVDHRADFYALGVTFYELITGSVPFKEGDVAYHHRHTPPPDPREQVPDLHEDFATLILQCMEKLPGDRPEDGQEICARLGEIARNA